MLEEVIIVGAGPCGISTAIECKKRGLNPLIIEKGSIVNTIYSYPLSMTFFSSADKIEIGNMPFTTIHERPAREEALVYYRELIKRFGIRVHTFEKVESIAQEADEFIISTSHAQGHGRYVSKYVVIATGYYDNPHYMNIPGENLPHVHHYFYDAHPYTGKRVVVIGGRHSAIHAALELQRAGADVAMIYRKGQFDQSIKPWIRPIIEAAIRKEEIKMYWESEVLEIQPDQVVFQQKQGDTLKIPVDTVFAMTGYRPDFRFFKALGAKMDPEKEVPIYSDVMETTVENLYLAGVVATGKDPTKIFIENGRFHGKKIAEDIKRKEMNTSR